MSVIWSSGCCWRVVGVERDHAHVSGWQRCKVASCLGVGDVRDVFWAKSGLFHGLLQVFPDGIAIIKLGVNAELCSDGRHLATAMAVELEFVAEPQALAEDPQLAKVLFIHPRLDELVSVWVVVEHSPASTTGHSDLLKASHP